MLGKDRGLIKNISFSRFDVKYAQEQLMTNQVGLCDELKMPYNANITMYGNNLFIPGQQIYINPSSIGFGNPKDKSSPAFRLGLGGYYTILGVSTSVVNGASETTLRCSFGSHATAGPGLTPPAQSTAVLGQMASNSIPDADLPASNPAPEPQHAGKLSVVHADLRSLKGQNGESVVDATTANLISQDYMTNPDDDAAASQKIANVSQRTSSPTGAKTYLLANGYKMRLIWPSPKASVVAEQERLEELAEKLHRPSKDLQTGHAREHNTPTRKSEQDLRWQ